MDKICSSFIIGKLTSTKSYAGPVGLDGHALYLALCVNKTAHAMTGGAGGVVGGLLSYVGAKLFPATLDGPNACEFHQLPEEIQAAQLFRGLVSPNTTVLVIPRASVEKLVFSMMYGVRVETRSGPYYLSLGPFSIGAAKRKFRSHGWLE
jgi:hypothetical protein